MQQKYKSLKCKTTCTRPKIYGHRKLRNCVIAQLALNLRVTQFCFPLTIFIFALLLVSLFTYVFYVVALLSNLICFRVSNVLHFSSAPFFLFLSGFVRFGSTDF